MMSSIAVLITILIVLITYYLQRKFNFSRERRHLQIRFPLIALIVCVIAQVFYYFNEEAIQDFFREWISAFFPLSNGNMMFADFVYFQVVALGFVIYKAGAMGAGAFRRWWKKKKGNKRDTPAKRVFLGGDYEEIFPYRLAVSGKVVRRAEWEAIYRLFFFSTILLWIALLCAIFLILKSGIANFVPVAVGCALLIIAEVYYYLDGEVETLEDDTIDGNAVHGRNMGRYYNLWREYLKRWPDKVLAAKQVENEPAPLVHKEDLPGIIASEEDKRAGLETIFGRLLDEGYKLTNQHCEIAKTLFKGDDIIIANADYNRVAPLLFSSLIKKTLSGHNILIITPYSEQYNSFCNTSFLNWLREWFQKIAGSKNFGDIKNFGNADYIKPEDRILASTVENLLDEKVINHSWIDNLKTVIIFESTQIFSRSLNACSVLLSILRKKVENLQCVIFTDYREALESSIRENLDIRVRDKGDIRLFSEEAALVSLILWKPELMPAFQEKVFAGDIQRHLSPEVVLAVLPWRDNIENNWLYCQEETCWLEYIEELENTKKSISKAFLNDNIKSVGASKAVKCVPVSQIMPGKNRLILFTRDKEFNLSTVLIKGNGVAEEEILHHIVSPPYLLRDYFAANHEHFRKVPKFALSSRTMTCKFSLALSLMMRMILHELMEEDILKEIRRIKSDAQSARAELRELFSEVFGLDIISKNYLVIKERYIFNKDRFNEILVFSLSPEMKKQLSLSFLDIIHITDSFNNPIGVIYRDHLFQNYLPGQERAFSGKPYRINDFDSSSKTLRVSHVSPTRNFIYRAALEVELKKVLPPILVEYQSVLKREHIEVRVGVCEAEFSIFTSGYFSGNYKRPLFTPLDKNRYERYYKLGRLLKFSFIVSPSCGYDLTSLASSLTVLLREIMLTILPETYQYLVICCNRIPENIIRENGLLFSSLSVAQGSAVRFENGAFDIYIFEDSNQDMGLLLSIYGMWEYIFKILDDYVAWVLEEPEEGDSNNLSAENTGSGESPKMTEQPQSAKKEEEVDEIIFSGSRRDFLAFNFGEIPDFIDLPMVYRFLNDVVGYNDLTSGRRAFYRESIEKEANQEFVHECDFCASPLNMAEYEVLDDGRERCKKCKDVAINHVFHPTFRDLKGVYKEARGYFKQILHITLRENIDVDFITAKDLNEKLGVVFTPTPKYDPRTVGFTAPAGDRHIIKIENGCPYHMTLATMVHELAHIWQRTFLNFDKLEKDGGNLMIEGLAVWAELNCLEVNNMAEDYRLQNAMRQDEYGEGYRKVIELMKGNKKFSNPFELFLALYQ